MRAAAGLEVGTHNTILHKKDEILFLFLKTSEILSTALSLTCLIIHLFNHFGFLVRVLPYKIGDFREISGKIHLFKRLNK